MSNVRNVKYSEFLNTAFMCRADIVVEQQEDKGYIVKAVNKALNEYEEDNIIIMSESQDVEKLKTFKSIDTLIDVLKSANIFKFDIKFSSHKILSVARPRKTEEQIKKDLEEKARKEALKKEIEAVKAKHNKTK